MCESENKLRVLELYSGIGGFHYALKESGLQYEVIAAVDINTTANDVYKYNFPHTQLLQRNIESITVAELEHFSPSLIWMSPPCQPFTRIGLKKDCTDGRTISFLHILNLLKKIKSKPSFILLENVKDFELSEAHQLLTQTLKDCGYSFQEFLLNPNQLGIPNSRLRYYIVAKLESNKVNSDVNQEIQQNLPHELNTNVKEQTIEDYIENQPPEYFQPFLLSDNLLSKRAWVLDIVQPQSKGSCCFTKSYGRYATGTGSVLQTNIEDKLADVFNSAEESPETKMDVLRSLKLRYFTPREIANLMGFPRDFDFPDHTSTQQRYQLLVRILLQPPLEILKPLLKT